MTKTIAIQATATFALLVALSALAGHVYLTYERISGDVSLSIPSQATATAEQPLPDEPEVVVPSLEEFSAVIERPIFSQSRRPPPLAAETADVVAAPDLEIELLGIVLWKSQRIALVRLKEDSGIVKIRQGADVAGWTAIAIEPSHVLFQRGDVEKKATLKYKVGSGGG